MIARTEAMVPYRSSMALDLAAGRPLEVGAIYDAPVAAARAAGVDVPRIAQLADILRLQSA
jgi:2-dehydropantoate 2-reductase